MRKLTSALFLCAIAALGTASAQKLSPELAASDPHASVKVIVQWRQRPNDSSHRKVTRRGGHLRRSYKNINSAAYSIPAAALQDLANDPEIEYVGPDRPVRPMLDFTAEAVNA